MQTMGIRIAEIVHMYHARYGWEGPTPVEVTEAIEAHVVQHVRTEGEAKPGVYASVEAVRAAGLPIAIASSSSERLIAAVVERLNLGTYVQVACSGDNEPEGKPHPGVYLTTARRLDVVPHRCLALEDSPNGVLSATAAGMACVAVPDPHLRADPRFRRADVILDTLIDFPTWFETHLRRPGGDQAFS